MTEPHAVRLNDLAAALNDTAVKYLDQAAGSTMYPAMFATIGNALLDLKQALTAEPGPAPEPARAPAYRVTLRGGGAGTTDGPGEPGSVTITPAPGEPLRVEITGGLEIKPGKNYAVTVAGGFTQDTADALRRRLADLFPGSTFGLLSGAVGVAEAPETRTVTCTCATVDVTVNPARPLYMPGYRDPFCDVHGYRDRFAAEIGLCAWRHPVYTGVYCTVVASQQHIRHAKYDRYGELAWDPTLAAQGQLARPAAKDWPEWTGMAS